MFVCAREAFLCLRFLCETMEPHIVENGNILYATLILVGGFEWDDKNRVRSRLRYIKWWHTLNWPIFQIQTKVWQRQNALASITTFRYCNHLSKMSLGFSITNCRPSRMKCARGLYTTHTSTYYIQFQRQIH